MSVDHWWFDILPLLITSSMGTVPFDAVIVMIGISRCDTVIKISIEHLYLYNVQSLPLASYVSYFSCCKCSPCA